MSDVFYTLARAATRHAMWVSSRAVVINPQGARRTGPYILAATHASAFDVPVILRHAPARVDFLSIVELFKNPFVAALFTLMNAFPLDRGRPDGPTVRKILARLQRGRIVGMFPEGGMKTGDDSVIRSRRIRPGIGRLAALANVPIVPCVILGAERYGHWTAWLPLRRTRYGVIFGDAISPAATPAETEVRLIDAWIALHAQLSAELGEAGTPA